jgi:hypothetical protein
VGSGFLSEKETARVVKTFAVILLLLLGLVGATVRAANADGRIVEWTGAIVLQTKANARGRTLGPADQGWRLRAGDTLQIPADASITLVLPAGTKTIRGPEKFAVPAAPPAAVVPPLLKDFSTATTRSVENGILDPAIDGTFQAGVTSLRWVPAQWRGLLRVQIFDAARRKIWSRDAVPGEPGFYSEPALQTALKTLATSGESRRARLSMTDESGKVREVEFRVLSPDEEKQFGRELAAAVEGLPATSWATPAARAVVLAARGFLYEAASEAERAALLAPKNAELANEAAARWREAGDEARAKKLLRR